MTNEHFAILARARAQRYPPRTPERRAAAALSSAPQPVRGEALVLLRLLEREAVSP